MVDPVGGGGRGPCPACLPLGTSSAGCMHEIRVAGRVIAKDVYISRGAVWNIAWKVVVTSDDDEKKHIGGKIGGGYELRMRMM
jgi:hypothetical protein